MHSMWKDLLFLHGHVVRKEDLLWRDQHCPAAAPAKSADSRTDRASAGPGNGTHPPSRRILRWPRLVAPH